MRTSLRPPDASWSSEFWRRVGCRTVLKVVGITTFITVFFVAYFHVLRHPLFDVTVMPLTALDDAIPFQPPALLAYLSLWVYVGFPPALLVRLRDLISYCAWTAALCLTGIGCFLLWPTAIPARQVDPEGFPGFHLIQGLDAAGNACPSLHVATAFYSAIWLSHLLREIGAGTRVRAASWLWFALIAYSTVAIKQHVVLDVLAGLALGGVFAIASLRLRPGAETPS